ncbi:MAG: hypothetical protein AAB438_02025 [Patescibacteria group bacterium]
MKNFFAVLVLFFVSSSIFAQEMPEELTVTGDLYELEFTSPNATVAHSSANTFANLVGDKLKEKCSEGDSSIVLNPSVIVKIFSNEDNVTQYRVSWSCRIVSVPPGVKPDYGFDRRGTLYTGASAEIVEKLIQKNVRESNKVQLWIDAFALKGKTLNMPDSFSKVRSFSGSNTEKKWIGIEEYFGTIKAN